MQLWVHTKSPIIGNKLGLIDVRPTGAALGLVSNGIAQFANAGGNSLIPVVDGDTEWKGWQAIIEADGNLPVNISLDPPEVTGRTNIGETLTCDAGTWVGTQPITFEYRWFQNNTPIIGETADTYVIRAEDGRAEIKCAVKATNAVGSSIESSNVVEIFGARYNYKTVNAVPASGQITSSNLQIRINGLDINGIDHSIALRSLVIGDSVIVGTQAGVIATEVIETSGYFIVDVEAWAVLPDAEYVVILEISGSN